MKIRVGASAEVRGVGFGEVVEVGGVRVSLHPAGHILGSAQVRVEVAGQRGGGGDQRGAGVQAGHDAAGAVDAGCVDRGDRAARGADAV